MSRTLDANQINFFIRHKMALCLNRWTEKIPTFSQTGVEELAESESLNVLRLTTSNPETFKLYPRHNLLIYQKPSTPVTLCKNVGETNTIIKLRNKVHSMKYWSLNVALRTCKALLLTICWISVCILIPSVENWLFYLPAF